MVLQKASAHLKIGVLIDELRYAGVEKIAVNEVLALRQLGFDAKLVVMRRGSQDNHVYAELLKNVPVFYLSDRLPDIFRWSFKFPIFSFFSYFHITYPFLVAPKIEKLEFDILVSHGTYTSFTAIGLWKTKKIPFISYIWDPASYIISDIYEGKVNGALLYAMKPIALFIDKIIAKNSSLMVTACKQHLSFINSQTSKGVLLYPATDPAIEVNCSKSNYIISVTAWKEGKEPEYLLKIAEKCKNVQILVAGSWSSKEYQQQFLNQINHLGLQNQFIITGSLSEAELCEKFSNALFFLQFKADIGFGMPALEAAANGCTFVIPRDQGVCDLFNDGIDGFYIKEKDLNAIVTYVKLFEKNPALATKMGLSAWVKVKQGHSWIKHAQRLAGLCEKAVGANHL